MVNKNEYHQKDFLEVTKNKIFNNPVDGTNDELAEILHHRIETDDKQIAF